LKDKKYFVFIFLFRIIDEIFVFFFITNILSFTFFISINNLNVQYYI